ncbi:MAG TPA: HAMP domain-containing sensor histidine kinase [Ilumatobacteraceae bacterium]|jgi:two-component system, OmpR family, sensor histidine kinase MprB|nr:HAMP domain-containing sensor histidine kinase [Ilumatobacteraceae bacterium]
MGLRWKIALALATVALIATSAVGLIGYRTTSSRLVDEVDRSIAQASQQMVELARDNRVRLPNRGLLEVYWVRVISADGSVVATSFPGDVPVRRDAQAVIGELRALDRDTVTVAGADARIHTIGLPNGAVQIGRSLDEVQSVLDDLRRRTLVLVISVSLAAALVGWLIAGTVAAPLSRLTRSAEDVGSSGDLDVDVPGTGTDEVGRLGAAFRYMLGALAQSRAEQHRLVQDAGHELRTPLTSLKTNLSVLRRHPEMTSEMREGVLDDLDAEVTELTELVNELVAVASGQLDEQPAEPIELAALAHEVAERVERRRSRTVAVRVERDAVVEAPRSALDRAITNLVDNACKFDQSGGPVDVVVDGTTLTVLDRGPGVPAGEEARIFDRFHRTEAARSMPGSGLGLSIVREVVGRAGGTVHAASREGGGAAIGFTLPAVGPPTASPLPPPTS